MLPLLLLLLAAPSVWCIAITVPSTVVSGEDLDFSWSKGVSPYVLKILINNKVVSQNNDWTATSNSWTASADTAPVGTIIKIRVIDSDNNMVISTGTEVVETNSHTEQGSVNTAYTATRTTATSGHKSTSPHDGSMTYDSFEMGQATVTNDFANDPSETGGMASTSLGGFKSTVGGQDELGATGMGSNETSSAADDMMATSTSAVAIASAATSLAVATGATTAETYANNLSATADSTATDSAASSTSTSSDSSSGTSTSTYIIVAAVVLVLACAIGGGVWWYLHSQKQKDPQQGEKGGHGQDHSDEEALVGGGHGHGDSETDQSEDEAVGKPKKGGSGGGKGGESETETEPSESEDDGKSRRR